MFDAQPRSLDLPPISQPDATPLARSVGSLRLTLKRRGEITVVERLFQSGCLKARFAATDLRRAGDTVLINTAGGMTGGDALDIEISWRPGTRGTITSQAAEKIYRSLAGAARVTTTLDVASGACAEWLPQETILFDRAALDRDIAVRLARDASFLGLEAVVLGRSAMGESVVEGQWRDAWRIWRDGRLIYADAIELNGHIAESLKKPAIARGAIAFATLLWVGDETQAKRDAIRAGFGESEGCAASSWNGLLAVRFAAADGASLRRRILGALAILRPGQAAPPLWQF
jgi:urease accessory protein